jgi:hypothetical protein
MSRLVEFYRGKSADAVGRTLQELWAWDDGRLEEVHDFIQWLFPLPEASAFNPRAPVLTADDIAAFRAEPALRENLLRSFARILAFLGLTAAADGTVTEGPNFAAREPEVWADPNHNWLRVTRILRSLHLLGLEEQSRALFAWLKAAHDARRYPVPGDTFRYWAEAASGAAYDGR